MAKYKEWLTPEGLELLSGWARSGMIDEEIARRCGCSTSTLYAWRAKYPEIDEAIRRGKEVVDYAVENALLANALSGNVTAQIYWLNNRMADRWRAKPVERDQRAEDKVTEYMSALREAVKDGD